MMNLKSNSDVCTLLVKGYFAQVKERISNTNINVNQTDENKRTPLILCGFIDDISWAISLAQLLLELGADINRTDNRQMNIIHYCVVFEQVELLRLLLESIDFNINNGDCYGNSPLIYAIVVGNDVITDMLIEYYQRYKIDINKTNLSGVNAFMQACLQGDLDTMKKLEVIGVDMHIKDYHGKSSFTYKENALAKAELDNRINEFRKQSRMVKFNDVERIIKLQQETVDLKYSTQKFVELDHNFERINQMKSSLKKIKRHKIDTYYVNKNSEKPLNMGEYIPINDNLKIRQIRPQTALSTSRALRNRNDWYSFLGPLYISLEQQYSTSFKSFSKHDFQTNDALSCTSGKPKGRQRRSSKSMGSQSRRTSISGRGNANEDASINSMSTIKSRKKLEAVVSAKASSRHLSKMSSNNLMP